MGTTSGELAITTYASGEKPWSHSTAMSDIDTAVSRLLRGRLKAEATESGTDATPTVANTSVLVLSQSGATSITDFDDGTDEQFLFVRSTNGNSTIVHDGTNIETLDQANFVMANEDYAVFRLHGTKWVEVYRSGKFPGGALADLSVTTTKYANNSITQAKFGTNSVGTAQLKNGTLCVTLSAVNTAASFGANTWLHYPTFSGTAYMAAVNVGSGVAYVIFRESTQSGLTFDAKYHSASPPHMLGGELWGMFLFLLRRRDTLEVKAAWMAPDPPWGMSEEQSVWPKGHRLRIESLPHPFGANIDPEDEVVLVDTREEDLKMVPLSLEAIAADEMLASAIAAGDTEAVKEAAAAFRPEPSMVLGMDAIAAEAELRRLSPMDFRRYAFGYNRTIDLDTGSQSFGRSVRIVGA